MSHHKDKVQSIAWHPSEASVVATGAYDKRSIVCDVRDPSKSSIKIKLTSDVECLAWNPHQPEMLLISTEDGIVVGHDVRSSPSKPLFSLQAHSTATCTMDFNPAIPNLLATGSDDKHLKWWDLSNSSQPKCLASDSSGVVSIL